MKRVILLVVHLMACSLASQNLRPLKTLQRICSSAASPGV